MFYYIAYGLNFFSDFEIPELESIKSNSTNALTSNAVKIACGKVPQSLNSSDVQHYSGNEISKTEFLLKAHNIANIHVKNGAEIICDIKTNDMTIVRPFLLGSAMAALLYQRRSILLHASVVAFQNKAFVFAAPSGTGKSTTAASLLAHGAKLLCDDTARITEKNGQFYSYPSIPHLKLWDDALRITEVSHGGNSFTTSLLNAIENDTDGKSKFRVTHPDFKQSPDRHSNKVPISAVFILARGEQPQYEQIFNFDALSEIKNVAFRAGIMSGTGNNRLFFEFSKRMVTSIPIFRLTTGKDLSSHNIFIEKTIALMKKNLGND